MSICSQLFGTRRKQFVYISSEAEKARTLIVCFEAAQKGNLDNKLYVEDT